jgi:hypothetical protein
MRILEIDNSVLAFKNHDPYDDFITDTRGGIWDIIYKSMWKGHTLQTAKMSLTHIEYILKYGEDRYMNHRRHLEWEDIQNDLDLNLI